MQSKLASVANENSRLLVNASKTAKYEKELLLKNNPIENFQKNQFVKFKANP